MKTPVGRFALPRDIAEFDAALALAPADRPVALLVLRAGTLAYLAVEQEYR